MSKKKGSSSAALRRRMKKKKKQGTSSPVSNRTQGLFPDRDLIDPPTADDPPPLATTTPARTTSKRSAIMITQTPPNRLLKHDLLPAPQDLDKERLNKPKSSTDKEAAARAKKQLRDMNADDDVEFDDLSLDLSPPPRFYLAEKILVQRRNLLPSM